MIHLICGSLGSGKSTYLADLTWRHFARRGGFAFASNYALPSGWAKWVPKRNVSSLSRAVIVGNPSDLHKFSLTDCLPLRKNPADFPGLLVLDDAHMLFGSRFWLKNQDWIDFLSNSRKLGWRTFIVTHDPNMIDKQIRFFCEYEVRFRSLRKVYWPWIPFDIPICPRPFRERFLAVCRYYGNALGKGQIAWRTVFSWRKDMPYDTTSVFRRDHDARQELQPEPGAVKSSFFDDLAANLIRFPRQIFDSIQLQQLKQCSCARSIIFRDGTCVRCGGFPHYKTV